MFWYRAEKQEMFEECLREKTSLTKNLEIFWRNSKTINSAFVWCAKSWTEVYKILLAPHNSSHHTRPLSKVVAVAFINL